MAKKISYHYGDEQYNSSGNYSQGQASTEGSRYINSFIKEAENFFTAAEGELKRSKGFDAAAFFEKRKNRAVEMKDRAAIAAQYLDNDAYLYSQEDYDSLRDYLKNFGTKVDEVMGYYQPAVTAKQGMRAYEDEILAYQENQKKNQLPQWMQDFNMPEISNPAYGVLNWLNQPKDNTRFRAINDQWTDDQRYNLGLMQMEDPQKAQKYAAQVNRGEDPFQIAAQAQATQTARENMDLEAERREIDRLKAELDAYYWNTDFDAASQQSRTAFDAEIKRREQEIANRERELTLAQRVQDGIAYKGMTGNADFAEKSAYTSTSFGAPNLYGDYRLDYKDPTYEYINNTDGVREQASMTQKALANKGYDLMTEEEVGIYNYVYATEGKEAAEEYLNNIQDTLSTRKATQIFEGMEGRTGREILYGIGAGVNQFGTGVENLVNFRDEYIPANPYVVAGQMVREDLEDTGFRLPQAMGGASLGQMAYDVVSTSANMAPSVAAGALLGPGVGTALMGASAAGNAYQEALNDGYSKEQARMYSTLVGVSEATMEKLLGGFTDLGGDITKGVVGKIVGGVENAVAKAALELGGSMVSEGFEEGLQEVITPWIKNLTLMADEDVNWDEVAYSTLLGALSTLPMEGPRSAVNAFRYSRQVTGSSSSGSAAPIATSGKARAVQISTNQEVDVGDFASIDKKGNATVKTGESTTADINDISFPDETAFRRYNTVLSLPGIDTNTANEALHYLNENGGAEDTDSIVGIRDSYARGYYGMAYNPHGTDSGLISGTLSKKMYQIGQKRAADEAQKAPTLKAKQPTQATSKEYKKVIFEGNVRELKGKKKASVEMMNFIADNFSGTTVHVFESYTRNGERYYKDNTGKERVAPHGQYVGNEIWVDLNAGEKGEGLSLNTFGHEMYHHVEKWNKKGAQDLASFLLRELGQKTDIDKAVQAQIAKARRAGYGEKHFTDQGYTQQAAENMVYDRAMSDLVADSLEAVFTHGDPAAALAKLRSEDQGLFDQIKNFVDEWVTKLRKFLKGGTVSKEGKIVANLEKFEQIQQMFMEAMDVAGQNFNAAEVAESPAFEDLIYDDDSIGTMYSTRDVLSWDVDWDTDNESSLKSQMTGKAYELEEMEPVTTVDFSKVSGNTYANILDDILKTKFGYKISRPDGAEFLFDAEAIATLRRYVHSDEEAAAVISAPYVLKRGKAISGHKNHKNLGHPSVTYAAPVMINEDRVNVAVCVLFGSKNRPHSLRVLMPSGNEYVMQKKKTDPKRTGASKKNDVRPSTGSASDSKLTHAKPGVKHKMNSLRDSNQDNSVRGILSRIDVSARKTSAEREHLGRYQDRLNQLKDAEARLADAKARMAEKPEKKELLRLQQQERMAKSDISRHKKFLSGLEKTDLFKRMIAEQRLVEYREKQKAKWDAQAEEYRQVRKQLTGADSVISVMEDEFVKLAKAYEDKIIDLKTMEREFIRLAKEYDKTAQEAGQVKGLKEDTAIWQREFRRLMREYDTAGRKIERLEATIERQRQRAAEKVQSRRDTEMRNKIIRRVGELEKMLLRGSKTSYVPETLRGPVSAILDAIDLRKSDKETKVAAHLLELKEAYRKIQKEADVNLYDDGLRDYLDTLTDKVGNTKLGDMTSEQMNAVYDIITVVLETVRNANEAFVAGKWQMVSEMSETAMREVRSIGGNKNQGKVESDIVKGLKAFMWNDMRPVDIFNAIGSGQLKELFNSIRKGEDIWATDIREAREFFRQQWQKFKGDSWDMDKTYSFKSASGMGFQLNTEQIMSIYALFRRDKGQAMAHLRQGGFVFDNTVVDKNGKTHSDATAYNLTDATIMQIIGTLTKDQRAFVEAMQGYLSDTMGAKGNEVSMKMYGIKLFREKNYFPLRSADQYMERAKAQQSKDNPPKLKNAGFTKPVQEGANTAIVLTPFLDAWGSHVDEMSNYHAFVLPMEDFYRVYNYRTDVSSEESATRSVQAAIQNAYGEAAVKAIDQLLKDINGGVRGDSTAGIINKMISRYKKGATMASLSVAVQQPSAILRAAGMIDARYFVGAKPTSSMVGRTWEEIKKYAPIATIKEIGSFDTNTGRTATQYLTGMEYDGFSEKFRAFFADGDFRDDMLGRLPAFMDEVSWSVIWNSVKREQAAKNPGMDTQSEAFMQKVADRFTDVIVNTQVYDSVLAKNAMIRSKESGMKMVTAFMAEPTVTANMIAGAFLNFRRTGDKKALAKTLGSIVAATVVNAAAVAVVYALRDDDEDERLDEKWIASFRENLLDSANPMGYIPVLRDVQSVMQGYDVERPDMSVVSDFVDAMKSLTDEDVGGWEKAEKSVGAIMNAFGVPAKNVIRDVKGIYKTLAQAFGAKNKATSTGYRMAWRGERLNDGEQLLLAIQSGDTAHMSRVAERFETQQKAMNSLMTAIRRQYVEGIMDAEEAKELLMTYNELSETEVYWKLQEWDYAKANGTSDGYTKMGDLMAAVATGEGLDEQIQRYRDNGMDDSDIRSQISREYHQQYLEADEAGREQIRQTVGNALRATGSTESDIQDKFKGWDFETEYGMTYSDMIEGYREGEVNRIQMRDAMTFYGLKNFEINEKLADLDGEIAFMNQYGMSLSEMKALYGEGDITRNQMVNALVYSGKSKNEAQEMVTQMDIENRIGIEYAKLDDAYRAGDISRNTLYNAMLDNGATREEADEAIVGYDWLKRNAQGDRDLTITDAKKFAVSIGEKAEGETLTDYGVSIAAYKEYKAKVVDCKGVDANGDGKTDSGTLRDSILRMIDSLPISDTAKDGLALLRYSKSSIRKNAPWH